MRSAVPVTSTWLSATWTFDAYCSVVVERVHLAEVLGLDAKTAMRYVDSARVALPFPRGHMSCSAVPTGATEFPS